MSGVGLGISDLRSVSAVESVPVAEIVTHPVVTAKHSTSGSLFR